MSNNLTVVLAVEIFIVEKAEKALKRESFDCGQKCC
jgi:hypothetical protein